MDKTIVISLSGHPEQFRLRDDAYDRLTGYLDGAASRLRDDPDRAEVLGDLERSIGDKLAAAIGSEDRLVTRADIDRVLEAVGTVDTGREPEREEPDDRPRPRRLRRIKEGQWLAGVCTGLADYSDIRVDWVRTLFIFATLLTAGGFALVYVAMAFILPVSATRESPDLGRR
jgi:phage shock protein PspC (stress-responsive transcriptional regulator)